jgi:hypothetical protein
VNAKATLFRVVISRVLVLIGKYQRYERYKCPSSTMKMEADVYSETFPIKQNGATCNNFVIMNYIISCRVISVV